MKNLKEDNIQKSLWHIKRHCENIEKNTDDLRRKIELLHLKESVEILKRVFNDEKPYPNLDREEVFWNLVAMSFSSDSTFCKTWFDKVAFLLISKSLYHSVYKCQYWKKISINLNELFWLRWKVSLYSYHWWNQYMTTFNYMNRSVDKRKQ